jgi:DnaJ-class molecular chaperone
MSKKVKIFCHACEGKKTVEEKRYPNGETIKVICPECNGEGWVWDEEVNP